MTRDVLDGGCSFGFNFRAYVCVHVLCTYACSYAHVEAGGWHWMASSLSLSSLYFLTQGLSLSWKLTASARLAEQQPLGIPPFEWNYSRELHGCWESKLGCSCLYSKQFIYCACSPAQFEVLIEDMWREGCSLAPCGLKALIRNNPLLYKPIRILGCFLLQHSLLWSTSPCVPACFRCCRHCVSVQHPLGHH